MDIYWISGSAPCWKVLLLCETQGIKYQSKKLEVQKKQQKQAAYLSLNPRGKVPTIDDDGFVLRESDAILRYLDQKFLDQALQGKDPKNAAEVNQLCCEIQNIIEPAANTIVRAIFRGDIAGQFSTLHQQFEILAEELSQIEARLNAHTYLSSNSLSLADYHLAPCLMRLERAFSKDEKKALEWSFILPFAERFRATFSWLESIKKLPGAANAYPPHWR